MADYIDIEKVMTMREPPKSQRHYQTDNLDDAYGQGWDDALNAIEKLPKADVVPVKHGHWIKDKDSFQTDDYYCCYFDYSCSECGHVVNNRCGLPNYCSACGTEMSEVAE